MISEYCRNFYLFSVVMKLEISLKELKQQVVTENFQKFKLKVMTLHLEVSFYAIILLIKEMEGRGLFC